MIKEKALNKLKQLVLQRNALKFELVNSSGGKTDRFYIDMDRISKEMMGAFEVLCEALEHEAIEEMRKANEGTE